MNKTDENKNIIKFDPRALIETKAWNSEEMILSQIRTQVDGYRQELEKRFRRKEDRIIVSSEAKRFRLWLLNGVKRNAAGLLKKLGSQLDPATSPCIPEQEIRNEISVEVESHLERLREELRKKYRRVEDQPSKTLALEHYREWILAPRSVGRANEFLKFPLQIRDLIQEAQGSEILDNRYEIISTIETSSHRGCLYKVSDRRLRCIAAIRKILPSPGQLETPDEAEQGFICEANLLFNLHHSGLPKVSDFFTGPDPDTGGTAYYLVMTFIEGKSLEAIMQDRGNKPLSEEEVKIYFRQILDILSFLNSRIPPVIYQDMKPSNLVIQGRTTPLTVTDSGSLKVGRVFLMDFGVARILSGTNQQPDGPRPANDLYSLAILVYFLLTGRHIRVDFSSLQKPEPVRSLNPSVSQRLDDIIMSIMNNFAAGRPDSPERVIALLEGRRELDPQPKQESPAASRAPVIQQQVVGKVQTPLETLVHQEAKAESLHAAVNDGDSSALEELLEMGLEVNEADREGLTPLHIAAERNDAKVMTVLIGAGARVDAADPDGFTPLHLAAREGNREAVELLLSRGADLKIHNHDGQTPLHLANSCNQEKTAEILMDAWTSSIYDQEQSIPEPEVTAYDDTDMVDGMTELHLAVRKGETETVEKLLEQGFYPDPRSDYGLTPLHEAARLGIDKVAQLLISRGADQKAVDVYGNTPGDLARQNGHRDLAEKISKIPENKAVADPDDPWASLEGMDGPGQAEDA